MNKFKRLFLACSLVAGLKSHHVLLAQQIPIFTQYREQAAFINPAALNQDFFTNGYNFSFGASYRRQWLELNNAPTTKLLRGEWFQKDREGFNLLAGGYVVQDATGPTGFTGAYARVGGIFTDDAAEHGISTALTIGMVQYRINTNELQLREKDDIIMGENRQQTYPDIGLGVFAYQKLYGDWSDDIIYAGVSMPQSLGLNLNFKNGDGSFSTQRVRHYYAQVGWYHFLGEGMFLEPSVWLKYVANTPFNADINLRFQLTNSFWIGAGASNRGKVHAELGVIVGESLGLNGRMRIGYGIDYAFASYAPFVGATHEFNIGFAF